MKKFLITPIISLKSGQMKKKRLLIEEITQTSIPYTRSNSRHNWRLILRKITGLNYWAIGDKILFHKVRMLRKSWKSSKILPRIPSLHHTVLKKLLVVESAQSLS